MSLPAEPLDETGRIPAIDTVPRCAYGRGRHPDEALNFGDAG
jgi:hypothetical protein